MPRKKGIEGETYRTSAVIPLELATRLEPHIGKRGKPPTLAMVINEGLELFVASRAEPDIFAKLREVVAYPNFQSLSEYRDALTAIEDAYGAVELEKKKAADKAARQAQAEARSTSLRPARVK